VRSIAVGLLVLGIFHPGLCAGMGLDDPLAPVNASWWQRLGLNLLPAPSPTALILAIVDTGVDLDHEEFADVSGREAYLARAREADGRCGALDCCPTAPTGSPSRAHGTAVAGLITASRANGVGIAGIGRAGRMVSVDVIGAKGGLAAGLRCAIEKGARLINVSMQGQAAPAPPPELAAALALAEASSVLVVMAAGNGIADMDQAPEWPAALHTRTSLTVTAVDLEDRLTGQHFGRNTVDLAAPATDETACSPYPGGAKRYMGRSDPCHSNASRGAYGRIGQSSAAAAMVTGAALLIWGHPNYRRCSAEQVRALLLRNARPAAQATTRAAMSPVGGILDLHFLETVVRTSGGVTAQCSAGPP